MNSEATSYNDRIVREFRAHAGHVGGEWAGTPLILVHHVGARSGTERVTPLGCFPLDDGRYAVAASSGMTGTSPGMRSSAPVAARISATSTPGARSRSTSPSSVGSITAMSVTISVTRRGETGFCPTTCETEFGEVQKL